MYFDLHFPNLSFLILLLLSCVIINLQSESLCDCTITTTKNTNQISTNEKETKFPHNFHKKYSRLQSSHRSIPEFVTTSWTSQSSISKKKYTSSYMKQNLNLSSSSLFSSPSSAFTTAAKTNASENLSIEQQERAEKINHSQSKTKDAFLCTLS